MEEDGGEGVEGVASTTAILKDEKKIPEKPNYRYLGANRIDEIEQSQVAGAVPVRPGSSPKAVVAAEFQTRDEPENSNRTKTKKKLSDGERSGLWRR